MPLPRRAPAIDGRESIRRRRLPPIGWPCILVLVRLRPSATTCAYFPGPRTDGARVGWAPERAKEQDQMKVILLQEVPGLGQPGDVKEVANGYARNYLLPRKLVTAATATAMASLNEQVAAAK